MDEEEEITKDILEYGGFRSMYLPHEAEPVKEGGRLWV